MTTHSPNTPTRCVGVDAGRRTRRHADSLSMPLLLRLSLVTQFVALGVIAVFAMNLQRTIVSTLAVMAMIGLVVVSRWLAAGSFIVWIGARRCAATGIVVLGGITALTMLRAPLYAPLGIAACCLQLQYIHALSCIRSRQFFATEKRSARRQDLAPYQQEIVAGGANAVGKSSQQGLFSGSVKLRLLTLTVVIVNSLTPGIAGAEDRRIRVTSVPRGAEIWVNGSRMRRTTPATVPAQSGDAVVIRSPGYAVHKTRVGKKSTQISAKLKEITKFTMLVEVKTSDQRHAGTNNLTLVLQLNGKEEQQFHLNNRGDDRRVGARDKYTFQFDCPTAELKGIRIAALAGDDAWKCDYIAVRMVKADKSTSQTFPFKVNGWFSADAKEGRRHYDAKFSRLKFVWDEPSPKPAK